MRSTWARWLTPYPNPTVTLTLALTLTNPNPNPNPNQAAPSIDEAAIIHFVGRDKPWMLRDTMSGKLLDPEVAIVSRAIVTVARVSRAIGIAIVSSAILVQGAYSHCHSK